MKDWSMTTFDDVRPGNIIEHGDRTGQVATISHTESGTVRAVVELWLMGSGSPVIGKLKEEIEVYR